MKKIITISLLMCSLLLTGCVFSPQQKDNIRRVYNAEKYLKENYVDARKLPILDIDIENPFVSDDRTLILDDNINNSLELMIYEYYHNLTSGSYKEAKDVILDGSLLEATKAHENNFKNGIYYSQIFIDEIDLVDRDDLEEITNQNKQAIIDLLNDSQITEFAIVEVETVIKHNDKALSMTQWTENDDITRYYLLGKKDNDYKIIEVYWENFMND